MSDLFDSPADRWGLIFYSSGLYRRAHTRQEWAHITHAHRPSIRAPRGRAAVDTAGSRASGALPECVDPAIGGIRSAGELAAEEAIEFRLVDGIAHEQKQMALLRLALHDRDL